MIRFDQESLAHAKHLYSEEESPAAKVDALTPRLLEACAGSQHSVCLVGLALVANRIISEAPPLVRDLVLAAVATLLVTLHFPEDEEPPLELPPGAYVMSGSGEIN